MSEQSVLSDYEAVGGGPAVKAVVDDFYRRVLGDPQLMPYFEGIDMTPLKRHQALLVGNVLGGGPDYDGRPLSAAHAGLGITDADFDRVVTHLAAALTDAGVPDGIIDRAGAAVLATRPDIVESR